MRLFTAALAFVLGIGMVQPSIAADTNKEKIVGQWKLIKGGEVPAGTVIEFTKAGKVVIIVEINGKPMSLEVGTYIIEGDRLTLVAKKGDKDDTEVDTIKSLTADKLVLIDSRKKEIEFERVKPKEKP